MPIETQDAVNWALQQTYTDMIGIEKHVTSNTVVALVDKVREYFNRNKIVYSTFSYDDLKTYL